MKFISNLAAFILVPVFGAVFGWWGIAAILDGNTFSGAIAIFFALAFFCFAFQWAAMRSSAHPRAEVGSEGITIRPRKLFDTLSLTWVGAAVLGALLYAVLAPFGLLHMPVYRSTPWLAAFILLAGVPTLWRMIAHGGDSYLRLTPDGCEMWNGQWLALRRAGWDEIAQIQDHPLHRKIRGRELIVLVLPEGRSATLLADGITDNSNALREWVRFYWQHPECRDELTDGRALQRLDDEKFTIQ